MQVPFLGGALKTSGVSCQNIHLITQDPSQAFFQVFLEDQWWFNPLKSGGSGLL